MLQSVHPKLPMRDATATRDFYVRQLGFRLLSDYGSYLILERGGVQLHFFHYPGLDPLRNYGQVYIRCTDIDGLHRQLLEGGTRIHPNGGLGDRPWGQREFSLLDPDHNLLTFGQPIP